MKDVKIKLSKQKNEIVEKHIEKQTNKPLTNHSYTEENVEKNDHIQVKSPLVGTFYAADTPDAKPYVQVGQKVKKGQVICIVEAMKIMNEITSPATGIIKSIEVHNKDVIGYDQILMTIGDIVEK